VGVLDLERKRQKTGKNHDTTIAVPADIPRSVYLNFTNALSLAHRIGVKPTTEMVKRLEISERAREEQRLNRPNKRPRVKHNNEVSLGWSSDDDVEMFLESSAGPSSWCAKLASPLEATNLFPSGYNTTHATIDIISVVPYIENIICCPNVISDFTADTGGKGSLTWQVHCEFMVGSETICSHFTQWIHAGFFSKVPSNLPPKNPPGKG